MLQFAGFCLLRVRTALVAYGFLFLVNILAAISTPASRSDLQDASASPQAIVTIQ